MRRRVMLSTEKSVIVTITLNDNVKSITLVVGNNTRVYTQSAEVKVLVGEKVTWSAIAVEGYKLSEDSGDFGNIQDNVTISPTATRQTFTINIKVGLGIGSITVNGQVYSQFTDITVNYGESIEWSAKSIDPEYFRLYTDSGHIDKVTSNQAIEPVVIYLYHWNGEEYIDLGRFNLIWATCNLGASNPGEDGDLFQWGETSPHVGNFDWASYKFGGFNSITKYCTTSQYGTVDGKTTLEAEDDAAAVIKGSPWRMPRNNEDIPTSNRCLAEFNYNGKHYEGSAFINSENYKQAVFFANNGMRQWNASLNTGNNNQAWVISESADSRFRYEGHTIRPVRDR